MVESTVTKNTIFTLYKNQYMRFWYLSHCQALKPHLTERSCEPSHTGQPRYVKLAYLEYMAYVEVIIHSRAFPLYCFVFQTCFCRTWLSRNLGYIDVFFHSRKIIYDFLTTTCVGVNFVLVKKLNNIKVKQSN